LLLTVHTEVVSEPIDTGNPDDEVALTANGGVPSERLAILPKVMVCASCAITIENACVAGGLLPLLAVTTPANVPALDGVPLMSPLVPFRFKPGGKLPEVIENPGGGKPDARTLYE